MSERKVTVTEGQLDELVRLAEEATARKIDAGACRTRLDFQRMHDAEDALREYKDRLVEGGR